MHRSWQQQLDAKYVQKHAARNLGAQLVCTYMHARGRAHARRA